MKSKFSTVMILLLSAALMLSITEKSGSQAGARMAILPRENIFSTLENPVGSTFTVNVTVYDIIDLFTWQINVTFDPALLNMTNIYVPTDNVFAGKTLFVIDPYINVGWVIYGATLFAPEPGVNVTQGRLAQIEFQIISAPPTGESVSCSLDFSGADDSTETFMLDSQRPQKDIPFLTQNGYYEYSARLARAPWDITGPAVWVPDGKCDMRDVGLVASLFGSVDGDGTYDARADITGPTFLEKDGKIDMRDIGLVASHFGETYS